MIDAERVGRNDAGRRQREASRETKAAKSVPWCLSKFVRKARVRSIGIPQLGMKVANCVALARQSCGQHRHGLFMAHNPGDDRYSVTIVDIDDPAAANAGSELFDLHAVQLQSRPFKARRIIVRLDTARSRRSPDMLAGAGFLISERVLDVTPSDRRRRA